MEKTYGFLEWKGALIEGVLATVASSVCCVAPLVLLGIGIGGAWISILTGLERLRPVFIGLTMLFLGRSM